MITLKKILIVNLIICIALELYLVNALKQKGDYLETDFIERKIIIEKIEENNNKSEYLLYDKEGGIYSTWEYNMLKDENLKKVIQKDDEICVYIINDCFADVNDIGETYIYGLKKNNQEYISLKNNIEELNSDISLYFIFFMIIFIIVLLIIGLNFSNKMIKYSGDDVIFDFRIKSQ